MPTNQTAHRIWTKVINFAQSTLNTSKDGADIGDLELQSCSNFIFDNGVLEKAGGLTKVNSAPIESSAPIMGVFRSHDTYGNKTLLASCNGKLKRWSDPNFVDVQTGMTVGERVDFLNWDNDTIIVNGKEEALAFTPRTNGIQKWGLEPPRFYKKVAYFESDETIVHSGNGTTDTSFIKTTERTGKHKTSLKLTATVGTTDISYVSFASAQNFSIFPNGASISTNDMLCVDILHRTIAYVDELYIDFWTSAGNYHRLTIDGSELDPEHSRDNKWTSIIVKKSRFTTVGSPSWSNINRVYFSLKSQTGTAIVYFDNVYFKNSPIEVKPNTLGIDNFETSLASWTPTTCVVTADTANAREGLVCMKIVHTGATGDAKVSRSFSPTLNLNYYGDGVASPISDSIGFWLKIVCAPIVAFELRFTGATGDLVFSWGYILGAESYTQFSMGEYWRFFTVKKSDFSGDPSNWATISAVRFDFDDSGAGYTTYIDDLRLVEENYIRNLATMESGTETWTFSGNGGFSDDKTKLSQGLYSIYLNAQKSEITTATLDVATQNLTIFNAASEVSTADDLIAFWTYWTFFNYIDSIKLTIDCNTGDFAQDYFEYEWTKDVIINFLSMNPKEITDMKDKSTGLSSQSIDPRFGTVVPPTTPTISIADVNTLNNRGLDLEVEKSKFRRVGSTTGKGWNTVEKYKFTVKVSSAAESPLIVYFDNLVMKRGKSGLTGLYQWCCVFESQNAFSAPSEFSDIAELSGSSAMLYNLPVSSDSNVMARHFFRKGGTLGDDPRLDFTLYDNTTVIYATYTKDEELGRRLYQSDIPQGTIRIPLASKFGPIFKGSAILYRDPEDLKRLWFSNPKYLYAWSETQLIVMDSDINDIFLDDGILYLSCKNGMRRISVPLSEVGPYDIEEVGNSKISVSPYASVKAEQFRVVVSYDGVYIFNGQAFTLMSQNIDTYFNETVYTLSDAIAFYADQHLYISVKTLAGVRVLLDAYSLQAQWRTSGEDINCFCVFDGIGDNGEIYVGDSAGTVYKFNSGYETLAQAITKDFGAEGEESDPFNDIILTECHVIVKSVSSGGGQLQIQFRKDQALDAGVTLLFPVTGHLPSAYTVYNKMLRGEYNEIRGNKIGAILTHNLANKHCAIQTIKLVGEITPLIIAYE